MACVTATASSARLRNATMTDSTATRRLNALAELVSLGGCRAWAGALKVGVDPGTANIAVVVLDENDNPVAGISHPSRAVKDGAVVEQGDCEKVFAQPYADYTKKLLAYHGA